MGAQNLSRRWLAGCALLGLLLVAADEPSADVEETRTTFESRRKKVDIERFEPKTPGSYPVIIILHGVGGIDDNPRSGLRQRARELARAGYVALIPHYFNRTGANLKNADRNRRYFNVWIGTIRDAVTYAAASPNVDRRKVGLLGFSLGAHVAVSEAMYDTRISAVVEYAGGLLPDLFDKLEHMPPTLIIHGDADKIVPVAEARKLGELFDARGITYEMAIYPGGGHGLSGEDGKDAWEKTLAFFKDHVRREP